MVRLGFGLVILEVLVIWSLHGGMERIRALFRYSLSTAVHTCTIAIRETTAYLIRGVELVQIQNGDYLRVSHSRK